MDRPIEGNGGKMAIVAISKGAPARFQPVRGGAPGVPAPRSGKAVANAEVCFALNSINIYARAPDSARPFRLPTVGAAVRG